MNDAPIVAAPIADRLALENSPFTFALPAGTFDDADGDMLTLTATLADGSALPSWLTFNGSTGTFSGTPLSGDVGTISVRVTADDGNMAAYLTILISKFKRQQARSISLFKPNRWL